MKKIISFLLAIVFVLLLGGCGGNTGNSGGADTNQETKIDIETLLAQEPISLVIIAGKHANSYNFTPEMCAIAEELIYKAVSCSNVDGVYKAKVNLTVIVNDGKPAAEPFTIGNGATLETQANNPDTIEEYVEAMVTEITTKLTSDEVMAKEEGCDLQGSINQAKKALQNSTGEKHILIMDTGISTEGFVDMRQMNFKSSDAQAMISFIRLGAFPDLTGINVTFVGAGNVATPQPDFQNDIIAENKLTEFWSIFLEDKCGATLTRPIDFYNTIDGEILSSGTYPKVPVVEVVSDADITPIMLHMEDVEFVGDKSIFKNEAAATEAINEAASKLSDYFNQNPDTKVYVVGSIACATKEEQDSPKKDDPLSYGRAKKVLEVLLESEYSFNADDFVLIDAGTQQFSWRNADEFSDGKLNRENQEENRVVAIIPGTCTAEVNELIQAGEIER